MNKNSKEHNLDDKIKSKFSFFYLHQILLDFSQKVTSLAQYFDIFCLELSSLHISYCPFSVADKCDTWVSKLFSMIDILK